MDAIYDVVQPGDIALFRKPSFLQGLNEAAGDPFRHVGIVGPAGDVIQVKDDVIAAVPLEKMVQTYSVVVIARPPAEVWKSGAAEWAKSCLGTKQRYPLDDCFLVGLLACARAGGLSGPRMITIVEAAVQRAASRPARHGLTCSAFVALAFEQAGGGVAPELAKERSAVPPITTGSLAEAPPLDRLSVSAADAKRMAGDLRAIATALRSPLNRSHPDPFHCRLVGPGDLLESAGVREIVRTISGRIVEVAA